MSRRAHAALAHISTAHGTVVVRKAFAAKQRSFVAILTGPHPALRSCLPGWRPRSSTSAQTQVSPPQPLRVPSEAVAWIGQEVPRWMASARGITPGSAPLLVTVADSRGTAERTLVATVRPSTLTAYRKQWTRLLRHLPEATPLIACVRERVQAVANALLADGLAPTTVRAAITALHRLLAPAIDAGLVPASAFQRLSLPRPVVLPKVHLSRDQRDHLLALAGRRGRDLHLVLALGLLAGLRRGELLALTWADVDLATSTLAVRNGVHFTTKSGRNRIVPLCRHLRDLLGSCRPVAAQGADFVVAPQRPARRGLRWDFAKRFRTLVTAAGVPGLTVHGMRRAFATLAVQGGVSIWKVKGWLGHATVQVTERYTADLAAFDADVERVG